VPPTGFGFCELSSMHNESVFANFAVFNVQPRFSVVLPILLEQIKMLNFLPAPIIGGLVSIAIFLNTLFLCLLISKLGGTLSLTK
jgi:hypothetical protein